MEVLMANTVLSIEDLKSKKTAHEKEINISHSELSLKDNNAADAIDLILKQQSEDNDIEIARDIVNISTDQLTIQNNSKNDLKSRFTTFFTRLLTSQYIVLILLLVVKSFWTKACLSDTIVITYMTSVFIETLGAIAIMIKYAFSSEQEVSILAILNSVISNYQKFQ